MITEQQAEVLRNHFIVYQVTTIETPPLIVLSEAHILYKHKLWSTLSIPEKDLFEVRVSVYTLTGEHVEMVSEICNKNTLINRLNYITIRVKKQLIDNL
jgi:hypothetical protein